MFKGVKLIVIFGVLLICNHLFAQEMDINKVVRNSRDERNAKNVINKQTLNITNTGVQISYNIPYGDLAKRYGGMIGLGLHMTFKSDFNLFFQGYYDYLFFADIKEQGILDSISTKPKDGSQGYVISSSGEYLNPKINQRGHAFGLNIGYIIPNTGRNPNSGLFFQLGAGYLIHYIDYYVTGSNSPQLLGNYFHGYDRRTEGLNLSSAIGYMSYGKSKKINFSVEFQVNLGLTYSKRYWNYALNQPETGQRRDGIMALKLNWFLPFYRKDGFNNEFH